MAPLLADAARFRAAARAWPSEPAGSWPPCAPLRHDRPNRRRRRMSPDLAFPAAAARFGWLDVAAVAVILLVVGILVPPAIHSSRFHSRLASCQDKLRQVGLALTQYGYHHGNDISELADNERLTDGGPVCRRPARRRIGARRRPADMPRRLAGRPRGPALVAASRILGCRHGKPGGRGFRSGPAVAHRVVAPDDAKHVQIRTGPALGVTGRSTARRSPPRPPWHFLPTLPAPTCRAKPSTATTARDATCSSRTATSISSPVRPRATRPRRSSRDDDSPATPRVSVPIKFVGWH